MAKSSKSNQKVRFNILNHVKQNSLFESGMKPCIKIDD